MTRSTHNPSPRGPRRGSAIVLAVGVLAALAIIAVAYTVAVRSDKQSATSHAVHATINGQAQVVADEIGAILVADLFGNKIVTPATPRFINPNNNQAVGPLAGGAPLWPSMFEDGEFSDVPWVDADPNSHTFITSRPGQPYQGNLGSILFPTLPDPSPKVAPKHDDAWLASAEPVAASGNLNDPWDTWPQISNLRSAYRLTRDNSNRLFWVRDDGRYADLGRFFTNANGALLSRPDPTSDLIDFDDAVPNNQWPESGPGLGRSQTVFDFQINALGNQSDELYGGGTNPIPANPFPFEPIDERFWADADGDLRPDSRWQVIDALGSLGGLRWVVAARIIDNSGQINVNTALDSGVNNTGQHGGITPLGLSPQTSLSITNAETMGAVSGRPALATTPADIDLFRLLWASRFTTDLFTPGAWGSSAGPSRNIIYNDNYLLSTSPPRDAFRRFLDSALGVTPWMQESLLTTLNPAPATAPYSQATDWRYTFADRGRWYTDFAAAAHARSGSFSRPFSIDDEIELKTFWTVNNDELLSRLETAVDFGFLPGESSTTNNNPGGPVLRVGPLRGANTTANERSFQFVGQLASATAPRPTVLDVRDDTRRHLTTYSGVADFSPVPVLNRAVEGSGTTARLAFGDRPFNRKIRLLDFPINTRGAAQEALAKESRKFDLIRKSFESFAWALAPLATGSSLTDRPLLPPLDPVDIATIQASPNGQDYHYGGGPNSPAAAIKAASASNTDMGASYALLRAASLAINLADAMDDETAAAAANAPTVETPTVARLFNQVLSGSALIQTGGVTDTPGVLELGVRFSHGDAAVNGASSPALLPPAYVGQPSNGVTLVGLDRQPFLRSASFLAVYESFGAQGQAADPTGMPPVPQDIPLEIDTDDPAQQVGSIFAVELHNPWPRALDATGFRVAMATDVGWFEFLIDGASVDAIIPAGQTVAFYASVTHATGQAAWDPVEDEWEMLAPAGGVGAPTPRRVDPAGILTRDVATGAVQSGVINPVPFHTFGTAATRPTSVLLLAPGAVVPLLVDRLTTPAANEFPFTHTGTVGVPKPTGILPGQFWEGRIASAGSIRRPNDAPMPENVGFSACIVERPSGNLPDSHAGGTIPRGWFSTWESSNSPVPVEDLFSGPFSVDYSGLKAHIGETEAAPPHMPSVQLFVPNAPLLSPSELHMLSAFSHMFVHNTPTAISLADMALAANPTLAGEGSWSTISEQLGQNAHLAYDTVAPPDAANRNRYLGALDPSRFTLQRSAPPPAPLGIGALGGPAGLPRLPDSLAVPLAVRVFDCFEALDLPPGLAQGRMNLNTAPARALRVLPWMSPWNPINTPGFDGNLADASAPGGPLALGLDRAAALVDYRDADPTRMGQSFNTLNPAGASREGQTNLAGLRAVGDRAGFQPRPGLAATGEFALLARWNINSGGAPALGDVSGFTGANTYASSLEAGMADPGGTRFNTGMPTAPALNADNFVDTDNLLDARPNAAASPGGTIKPFDPLDDAEERLAIFRAVANVASTRSDVFTAWFVVRGYDPRRVAAIAIPVSGPPDTRLRAAMNELIPAHESRWLAVFDRSNVKSPTDRPKLVLLTELPTR